MKNVFETVLRLLLACHFVLRKLYTEPPIGVSFQILINLANGFREDFF